MFLKTIGTSNLQSSHSYCSCYGAKSHKAVTSRHPAAKQMNFGEKMAMNFADKVSLSYTAGIFIMP
jgi:hypothetical protein